MTEKEIEQLRTELARVRTRLAHERRMGQKGDLLLDKAIDMLRQREAELTDACGARNVLTRDNYALRRVRERDLRLTDELNTELAQVRTELKDLQGERAFDAQTTRESITLRTKLMKTRVGLNSMHAEMQERKHELAQAHKKLKDLQGANRALGQQLADVTANREFWYKEAQDAEAERDEWRKDWESTTAELSNVQKRLATLDAAEAALANCGIGGIYDEFDGLVDAIQQVVEHIKELDEEHAIWERHSLIATITERNELRDKLAQARAESDALDNTIDQLLERLNVAEKPLQAERQLRQDAERRTEHAETELNEASRGLRRMVELNEWSRNELDRMNERAKRAEARRGPPARARAGPLAQLVTPELAELLERLGEDGWPRIDNKKAARKFAASIREALDEC